MGRWKSWLGIVLLAQWCGGVVQEHVPHVEIRSWAHVSVLANRFVNETSGEIEALVAIASRSRALCLAFVRSQAAEPVRVGRTAAASSAWVGRWSFGAATTVGPGGSTGRRRRR